MVLGGSGGSSVGSRGIWVGYGDSGGSFSRFCLIVGVVVSPSRWS